VKLSEIAPNFGRFLPSEILEGGKKLCPNYHACLAARHVEKFREVTPSPKVIGAHTLNFNPIVECLFLKKIGGPPFPMGCALASLGDPLARVKIRGPSTP